MLDVGRQIEPSEGWERTARATLALFLHLHSFPGPRHVTPARLHRPYRDQVPILWLTTPRCQLPQASRFAGHGMANVVQQRFAAHSNYGTHATHPNLPQIARPSLLHVPMQCRHCTSALVAGSQSNAQRATLWSSHGALIYRKSCAG